MGEIVAVLVGIEKYDRAGINISAPFQNAVTVARHLLGMGAKGPNIRLLVNQTSSPDGYAGGADLQVLRAEGVRVLEEPTKANIQNELAAVATNVRPDSRLFVYWCGHGYAGAGDRILLCSDFNLGAFDDRTFNATRRFRRLGSHPDYACFTEQIFFVDVCAKYTDDIDLDQVSVSGQLRARQVGAFATREGGYSRGGFSDVALAWLQRQKCWPDVDRVLETLLPELEKEKLKPFILDAFDETRRIDGRRFGTAEPVASLARRPREDSTEPRAENGSPTWLASDTETGRLFRRLNRASELTANRTNVVRDEAGSPTITLGDRLYVRRGLEDEITRALDRRASEARLIVIDGEPGTGKSTILWATQRALKALETDVWLLDAVELPGVFGRGDEGTILSEPFRTLFRNLVAAGRPPVVLLDTVDVPLNTRGSNTYITALLTELSMADVTVVAASRPGEARMLNAHQPVRLNLFDYNDAEFPVAVAAYASAFVRDGQELTAEEHAQDLLQAAAQGYPIKEICRNPLTLRMLYSIYSPEQINFPDVDIVTLYREFWRRRVESDIRTDAKTAKSADTDLSECAMRIATAMLVAGAPELARDHLVRELQTAGLAAAGLDILRARGVINVSGLAPDHLTGFFHQTFFEHAAALAILRLARHAAIRELARRWADYNGNLFLGAVLERVLVLAEYEPLPVQHEAEQVISELLFKGVGAKPILAYLFVHRRTIPEVVKREIDARIAQGDTLTVERLLAIAANAVRSRRVALIEALGTILKSGNTRWIFRAMDLLLRFASPHLQAVRAAIRGAALGDIILDGLEKQTQSRQLYLRFLAQNFASDRDWTLGELARHFANAVERRSDEGSLELLEIAAASFQHDPLLVYGFEARAGLNQDHIQSQLTSEAVAQRMGDLYHAAWKCERIATEKAIVDITQGTKRGLALTGRLNALAGLLLEAQPADVCRAFELIGKIPDATVRVTAGRITWTRCLPLIVQKWRVEDVDAIVRHARALAGDVLTSRRNGHAEILFHVARHGFFSGELVCRLLGDDALRDPGPWLQTRVLGHRLIEGAAAKIPGAEAAFGELMRSPSEHRLLARAALAQLKNHPTGDHTQTVALRLAVVTRNAEAALDLLRQSMSFQSEDAALIRPLQQMVHGLERTGNVKSRRIASNIQFELIRTRANPELDWDPIVALVQRERDDMTMAQLVRGLGLIAARTAALQIERVGWLVDFAQDKGLYTRQVILSVCADLAERDPAVVSNLIEKLFELAFREKTDGNLIEKLQAPLFSLYRANDPRVVELAEHLIHRSAPLGRQTCHRVCGQFKRLFRLIVERMTERSRDQFLAQVPHFNKYLGRMIVEAVAATEGDGLADKLKSIAENPHTDAEIVSLANRFLHRELRTSGLEKWPQLYALIGDRQASS